MLIRKRKLTQNQARRINKQNSTLDDKALHTGVVIAHFGKQLDVLATHIAAEHSTNDNDTNDDPYNDSVIVGQIYRCHARTNLPMIATNDSVQFSYDALAKLGRIDKIHDRRTLITRPDRYHKLKPVVANVDILAVVFAPLPKPAKSLIDRYLLIANLHNIKLLLILNKADIIDDDSSAIYNAYQELGVDVIKTSIYESQDLLIAKLHGHMTIFAGQSGVGKSSLINQILPNACQDTNVISTGSNLGQHTTTTSRLMPYNPNDISQGGIIDTPGIREYGIWHLSKDDILQGFDELAPLVGFCQFRDCNHSPTARGCALWQAQKDAKVLAWRIDSLVALQAEAKG